LRGLFGEFGKDSRQEIVLLFLYFKIDFIGGYEGDFHSRKKGSQYQTNDDDAYFHGLGLLVLVFEFLGKTPAEEEHEDGQSRNDETEPGFFGLVPFRNAIIDKVQPKNKVNVLRKF